MPNRASPGTSTPDSVNAVGKRTCEELAPIVTDDAVMAGGVVISNVTVLCGVSTLPATSTDQNSSECEPTAEAATVVPSV